MKDNIAADEIAIQIPRESTSKSLEVDVDGGAADGNDSVEAVVLAAHGLGIAARRVRSIQSETRESYQTAPDPAPTTVMGEQVTPIGTLTPPRTTPKRPRRTETRPLLED